MYTNRFKIAYTRKRAKRISREGEKRTGCRPSPRKIAEVPALSPSYKLGPTEPLNPRILEALEKLTHLLLTGGRNKLPTRELLHYFCLRPEADDISCSRKGGREAGTLRSTMNNQFINYHKQLRFAICISKHPRGFPNCVSDF